jgi:DNA-directed RNA polymerase subunit beta
MDKLGRNFAKRRHFGHLKQVLDIPYLVELQKTSYGKFLQKNVPADKRQDIGLQAVFKEVFPITDYTGTAALEFVQYAVGTPRYDEKKCLEQGMTYEAPLRLTVRLVVYDVDNESGQKTIRDIKEQEVFFGTVPLVTEKGTFVFNGTERAVVSQLQRSPGIFFELDKAMRYVRGKLLYTARIIPLRGSWLDFEFDNKGCVYVRIDRRRKFPATLLFKALGYSSQDILNYFYPTQKIRYEDGLFYIEIAPEFLLSSRLTVDLVHPETKEVIIPSSTYITRIHLKQLENLNIKEIPILEEELKTKILAQDIKDPETGEIIAYHNEGINEEIISKIKQKYIKEFKVLFINEYKYDTSLRDTLVGDKTQGEEEAILEIYRRMRPTTPPTLEVAKRFVYNLFFNPEYYDLSRVGRFKLNLRLGLDVSITKGTLRKEDILEAVKKLLELKVTQGHADDIDHLGNRRVRAVGELLEKQYRIGLVRMERMIKEKMALQDVETLMPYDLINSKPVTTMVRDFLGTSQLSQFMDQTNPLSEITHKRRLSAVGPGGVTRERAGFEVRDVHPTHYGRICPIETPEGPNIGLIVSLATYARVNEFGFIETPYRIVKNGCVTSEIKYLTALEEGKHPIAQANALIDDKGKFINDTVLSRVQDEFVMVGAEEVEYMDVSPNQLVSVSSSIIPFLEHDDANRALMGSNMQRQAVPLLLTEAPLVGTGMEKVVARDCGVCILAEAAGVIEEVDASHIVVRYFDKKAEEALPQIKLYELDKFKRSNQGSCFNQKPLVKKGQEILKGQVLADGAATDKGELALGKNVLVAFMSWEGYNFEDAIVVSERLVRDDVYTSIHIEEFEVLARETKLGPEEITPDIPNVNEEDLKNLDESGVIRIGAQVKPGDILVGKITPKGEMQYSPEEKLLRAIFGEKASDVKDSSLRVPPGIEGIVINAKILSRKNEKRKDVRREWIEKDEVKKLIRYRNEETNVLKKRVEEELRKLLLGEQASQDLKGIEGEVLIAKGEKISSKVLNIPFHRLKQLKLADTAKEIPLADLIDTFFEEVDRIRNTYEQEIDKIKQGSELPAGVIKMVKVYVAMEQRLHEGDKMAGRHGNKGVVSKIVPIEDMPYLADGTPVDIVLNPLSVPSRMNIGQILETHLGWASKGLGKKLKELVDSGQKSEQIRQWLKEIYSCEQYEECFASLDDDEILRVVEELEEGIPVASPVFDGVFEVEIKNWLKKAGLPEKGKTVLYDGRTGEPFEQEVTVGLTYMMKLHHLVDEKIHARSIGPYSLITQQPLGGKAQFGGQRFGEMEVWALEAYGAAYTLQEMLTVKSDDVAGRTRMYEKIVKGDNTLEVGLPESFNVLVKELQALGLDIELLDSNKGQR